MTCEDIGVWVSILYFLCYTAVFTNGALLCFTMDILKTHEETNEDFMSSVSVPLYYAKAEFSSIGRVWMFSGFCFTMLMLQILIGKSMYLPKFSFYVLILLYHCFMHAYVATTVLL